jgi:exopolyphosphatase/guanosine-5'-triphosphate,3'-diphosphate pyrophosphatase
MLHLRRAMDVPGKRQGSVFGGEEITPLTDHAAMPAFAALDLGTNNCRLLIAAPTRHGFRVVDSFSRVVRLGEGLSRSGRLSEAAMERTLGALHVCADRIGRRRLRGLHAVATEACRRAENGPLFLDRVRRETGLLIDVISAREEAELALESCASLLRPGMPALSRALLFDIGGGSTEIAWIRLGDGDAPPVLAGAESLAVGVLGLAERFGDTPRFDAMVDHVASLLQRFEALHCIAREVALGRVRLVGTSGTMTTLAGVALGLERYRRGAVDGMALPAEAAHAAIRTLRGLGADGLRAHPCIGPGRASLTLPGCAIVAAILRLWPVETVVVADRGLRDGMLLRMMREPTTRETSSTGAVSGICMAQHPPRRAAARAPA